MTSETKNEQTKELHELKEENVELRKRVVQIQQQLNLIRQKEEEVSQRSTSWKWIVSIGVVMVFFALFLAITADFTSQLPNLDRFSFSLHVIASTFFFAVVPLTHLSGHMLHQKWKYWQPFSGGVRFVLFQALSWLFYAACLLLSMFCLFFWSWIAKYAFGWITSFGILGLASQVFMVSSLLVFEGSKQHTIAKTVRRVSLKFEPAVNYVYHFCSMNMLLVIVAAVLATLSEYTRLKNHHTFSIISATSALLLFIVVIFNTYEIGGRLSHSTWKFWQPFMGGARFIFLQVFSWFFFCVSVIIEIAFIVGSIALEFELFLGITAVAGILCIASEIIMILSLSAFEPKETSVAHTGITKIKKGFFLRLFIQSKLTVQLAWLCNIQFTPYIFFMFPFLFVGGLSWFETGLHWMGFVVSSSLYIFIYTFIKSIISRDAHKNHKALLNDELGLEEKKKLLRLTYWRPSFTIALVIVLSLPGVSTIWFIYSSSPAAPAWLFLALLFYIYMVLTFRESPEVTGAREIHENDTSFFAMMLKGLLDGTEEYFQGKILKVENLDPNGQYIFSFHPHGVLPTTVLWLRMSKQWKSLFPGINFNVLSASAVHMVPVLRDIVQWIGAREVSKQSFLHTLNEGRSVFLVPGGQAEMLHSRSGQKEIRILTGHKGFVRLAMQSGIPLVPILSFKEVEIFDNIRFLKMQRWCVQKLGLPVPHMPYGRFYLPIPRPVQITVVVGKPIKFDKINDPTRDQLNEATNRYFQQIEEIFEQFKVEAGCHDYKLVLLEKA